MKRTTFYSSLKNVGARFVKVSPVTLWKENRNFAHNSLLWGSPNSNWEIFWIFVCRYKWGSWRITARNRRKPIDSCQWDKKLASPKLYGFGGIFRQGNCETLTGDHVIASKQSAAIIPNWRRERAVGIDENIFVKPRRKGKAAGSAESEQRWALYWFSLRWVTNTAETSIWISGISPFVLNRERQTDSGDSGNSRKPGNCAAKEEAKDFWQGRIG